MAQNGISTLSTKEARQVAKLDLAAENRATAGNTRQFYLLSELPTNYAGNDIVENDHPDGLVLGRPWTGVSTAQADILTEDGSNLTTETGEFITME